MSLPAHALRAACPIDTCEQSADKPAQRCPAHGLELELEGLVPINEYRATFTADDYAAIARILDEIRADAAHATLESATEAKSA